MALETEMHLQKSIENTRYVEYESMLYSRYFLYIS